MRGRSLLLEPILEIGRNRGRSKEPRRREKFIEIIWQVFQKAGKGYVDAMCSYVGAVSTKQKTIRRKSQSRDETVKDDSCLDDESLSKNRLGCCGRVSARSEILVAS